MEDTFTRTIGDREITFKPPTDAQFLVLGRLLRLTDKLGEDEVKLAGSVHQLSKILDIIDSMVVNPADRDWLEEQILAGTADLTAIMEVFKAEVEEGQNRATKRTAKKATGRARRG